VFITKVKPFERITGIAEDKQEWKKTKIKKEIWANALQILISRAWILTQQRSAYKRRKKRFGNFGTPRKEFLYHFSKIF